MRCSYLDTLDISGVSKTLYLNFKGEIIQMKRIIPPWAAAYFKGLPQCSSWGQNLLAGSYLILTVLGPGLQILFHMVRYNHTARYFIYLAVLASAHFELRMVKFIFKCNSLKNCQSSTGWSGIRLNGLEEGDFCIIQLGL